MGRKLIKKAVENVPMCRCDSLWATIFCYKCVFLFLCVLFVCRGFGFITFADAASVDKVLAQPHHELDSKMVRSPFYYYHYYSFSCGTVHQTTRWHFPQVCPGLLPSVSRLYFHLAQIFWDILWYSDTEQLRCASCLTTTPLPSTWSISSGTQETEVICMSGAGWTK